MRKQHRGYSDLRPRPPVGNERIVGPAEELVEF
jgi:hypothetical protein